MHIKICKTIFKGYNQSITLKSETTVKQRFQGNTKMEALRVRKRYEEDRYKGSRNRKRYRTKKNIQEEFR